MVEKNEATKERIRVKDERRQQVVKMQLDERLKSHMELRARRNEERTILMQQARIEHSSSPMQHLQSR